MSKRKKAIHTPFVGENPPRWKQVEEQPRRPIRIALRKVREIPMPRGLELCLNALVVVTLITWIGMPQGLPLNASDWLAWIVWIFSAGLRPARPVWAFVLIVVLTKVPILWHERCHREALLRVGVPPTRIEDHSFRLWAPYVRVKNYHLTRDQMLTDLEAPTAPPVYPMLLTSGMGLLCVIAGWWSGGFTSWLTFAGLVLLSSLLYSIGDVAQRRQVLRCEPTNLFSEEGRVIIVYQSLDLDPAQVGYVGSEARGSCKE